MKRQTLEKNIQKMLDEVAAHRYPPGVQADIKGKDIVVTLHGLETQVKLSLKSLIEKRYPRKKKAVRK